VTAVDAWGLPDARAVAEAVVDVLEERGLVGSARTPSRMLSAAQVAQLLGRKRQWVYDHAGELGAFRYGDGPKPRIGFDLESVERWKRDRQIRPARTAPTARRRRSATNRRAALIPYEGTGAGP
jgi:predicted DNA-binding transcriptional regulator AlpA